MAAGGVDEMQTTGAYGSKERKPARTEEQKSAASLVARVRKRKCVMIEADENNRDESLGDIEFLHVPGSQWTKEEKDARGDRPCYEFNELRVKALRVINDMRANRPQGKVRAVEDADKDTADTREGLIRNIWAVSDGDSVTDYAADYQVSGGMGAWRVETVWADDHTFGQDIRVRPFKNPFCLWRDPACTDPLGLDADDWMISEKISKSKYEARWPEKDVVEFEDDTHFDDADTDWYSADMVRVCEYWYKEPCEKTLALLSNGDTVEIKEAKKGDTRTATLADGAPLPTDPQTGMPVTIKRRRVVQTHKIMSCIVSGSSVLEGPTEWPGKYFPFVQVFGEWRVIRGKVVWHGLTRFAKDAQRLTNVTMTAIAETIMDAPQSHYWATTKQAEGHLDKWKKAHRERIPFLPYNADPDTQGTAPQRMGGADVPVALMNMRNIASDLMKGTTGIFDSSIGEQTNETSGRAITARARQGEIATFNYGDNMAKGVRLTWIIVDDLVGKVYTAERSVRILGIDGAEKYVKVNTLEQQADGTVKRVNDLTKGKFDVTYTVGPSFSTQRQEATELYSALGRAVPQVWAVAGDLIFKSMDLPYAEQIAERMRALLPPPIQKQLAEGKKIPPEAQAIMAQAELAMQTVQVQAAEVKQAMDEAVKEQTAAKQASADLKVAIANLKAAEASLAKDVAEFQRQVAEKMLAMQQGGDEAVKGAIAEATAALEEQGAALFAQFAERLDQTHAQALASISSQPRRRKVSLVKQGDGSFVGELVDDGTGENVAPMGTATLPPGAPPAPPQMGAPA
jgi:hypothetical protein